MIERDSNLCHDMDYLELLHGVVFYDSRGLPQKMFTLKEQSILWTEQAFKTLGLANFIAQVLELPQFTYGLLTVEEYTIVITRQEDGYIAALSSSFVPAIVPWLQGLSQQFFLAQPLFISL